MPSGEIGTGDIPYLTCRDQIVQCTKRFLYRRIGIESVHMINIYMIRVQPFQAGFASFDQMKTGRTHRIAAFRVQVECRFG